MTVVSLFNGMGCIWLALDDLGIENVKRYSCEIDKYANIVNDANYPDTIQLGDVVKFRECLESPDPEIFGEELAAHCLDLLTTKIDLLVGGSPCQGFSFAGKQLNFDDPRSALFFEFVKIKEILNPSNFLLENVRMKKDSERVITDLTGVESIMINSALVSAQNRVRLYWTDIKGVEQPEDKGILLKDIIETDEDLKPASIVGRRINEKGVREDYNKGVPVTQCLQVKHSDKKSGCLTTVQKDNVLSTLPPNRYVMKVKAQTILSTIYKENAKSMIKRKKLGLLVFEDSDVRKLTPVECERLQTVPDNYTAHVSNTQRYRMLGNGWTVAVISHILKYLEL